MRCSKWFLLLFSLLPVVRSDPLKVRWRRPRVLGDPGHFTNFVNQPGDFHRLYKQVFFDACPYTVETARPFEQYQWSIFNEKGGVLYNFNGTSCLHEWRAPAEGVYTIKLIAEAENGTVSNASEKFFVKDIWLVALGDSFASGQGNPDVKFVDRARPSKWANNPCFRASFGSFSYLIYEKIIHAYPQHGVLFTYLACSEATIKEGLLGPQEEHQAGQVTDFLKPVVTTAQKEAYLSKDRSAKTAPDLILMSIGANDIGFFDVVVQVEMGTLTIESSFARLALPEKFANLTSSLAQVNDQFRSMGVNPKSVFYFEYYDPLHNQDGKLDTSCNDMFWATEEDLRIAYESVLRPLNFLIRNQSDHFGWNCVDNIAEAFRRHGICSNQSYIRSMEDTLLLQGTAFGAFHPTYIGHRLVTDVAWPKIKKYLGTKFPH